MKLCNHSRFSTPSIYHDKKHYFFDNINIVNGVIALACCYYTTGKFGKWNEDTVYMTNIMFAQELFRFAIEKKLINKMPDLIWDEKNTLARLTKLAKEEFETNKKPNQPWVSASDLDLIIRNYLYSHVDQRGLPTGEQAVYCEILTEGYTTKLILSHYEDMHSDPCKLHSFTIGTLDNIPNVIDEAVKVAAFWGLTGVKDYLTLFMKQTYKYMV
jgi:hypothetical protein